jgi:hypothetical protein
MKTIQHRPDEKLQDVLVSILAGIETVYQINTSLRPDRTLAKTWNREIFAEQSTIADTLDALTQDQINQLREGSQHLFVQHSRTMQHDFKSQWLMIDVDPTGLPASRNAEGSRKGYYAGKKNQYGRQLARIGVPTYHETLASLLYAGNQHQTTMLKPSVTAAQASLSLEHSQRRRTIIRSDAGLGTDANVNWILWRDYEVLMKGFSGRRAAKMASNLDASDWIEDPPRQRWIARAPNPPRFGRRVNTFVLRWQTQRGLRHGTLLSTLSDLDPLATWRLHDGRGAIEIEIKADKQGLHVPKRRKRSLSAQEGLILLTDLAHNILSWFHHWVLEDTLFVDFGTKRMVDELMNIPGRVEIMDGRLHKVALLESHPYAGSMREILTKLLETYENP